MKYILSNHTSSGRIRACLKVATLESQASHKKRSLSVGRRAHRPPGNVSFIWNSSVDFVEAKTKEPLNIHYEKGQPLCREVSREPIRTTLAVKNSF